MTFIFGLFVGTLFGIFISALCKTANDDQWEDAYGEGFVAGAAEAIKDIQSARGFEDGAAGCGPGER